MDNRREPRQTSKPKQPDLTPPVSGIDSSSLQHSQLMNRQLSTEQPMISKEQEESLIRFNHITYLLYVLSYFTAGLLWVVPIIMNYARRRQADHTWLATHFDWQIKTFWYSIAMGVVGILIAIIGIGGLGIGVFSDSSNMALSSTGLTIIGGIIFLFAFIWHIYRIVKGWIALSDNRPVQ